MKIPFIYPGFRGRLIIESEYVSDKLLISIGCDCHPTYVLQRLHLRKMSLPFDWLNTNSLRGIEFVIDNINTNFEYFLIDLKKNERNHIVSSKYPFSEFFHEKDLIESEISKIKIKRRIKRFFELFNGENCVFLYSLTSCSISSTEDIDNFFSDILMFVNLLKNENTIKIYIRYEEDFSENEVYCNQLFKKLIKLQKVSIVKYIRETKKYGTWGNENNYTKLLGDLDVTLKRKFFPKIYLKRS